MTLQDHQEIILSCACVVRSTHTQRGGRAESRSEYVSGIAATVCGMDVRIDPERAEVVLLRRPQDLDWHVALVLESHATEGPALSAAAAWRARLGLVGRNWVRREAAAVRLGVGVKMIDKLRRQGRLRSRRVPHTNRAYVLRDDLDALVTERAERGA